MSAQTTAKKIIPFVGGLVSQKPLVKTHLVIPPLVNNHLPFSTLQTFGSIYFNLIDAVVDRDDEYLE